MRSRTDNHIRRIFCADLSASFARHRAALVQESSDKNLRVIADDGVFFQAEGKTRGGENIWLHAGPQGHPFTNGPSINRRLGALQYSVLLLPKTGAA